MDNIWIIWIIYGYIMDILWIYYGYIMDMYLVGGLEHEFCFPQ